MLTLFKKVWGIYKPLHKVIVGIFVLLVFTIGLDFVWPYIYGKTLDSVIKGVNMETILLLLATAFGVMCLQNIIAWIEGLLQLNHFDYDSSTLIQNLTLRQLLTLSIGQHRNEHSGMTQSVISDGQNAVQNLLSLSVYQFLPYILRIALGLIILFIFSWPLGLIAAAGVSLSIVFIYFINNRFVPLIRQERDLDQEVSKKRMEVLRNAPLVIANAGEAYSENMLATENERVNVFGKSFWRKYYLTSYIIRPLIGDFTLIVSIAMAAFLVSEGNLSAGAVVTVILWTNTILTNLGSFAGLQRQILFSGERAKKYFGILDLSSDVVVSKNPVHPDSMKGEIEFKNVSFTYPKKKIIEDLPDKKSTVSGHPTLESLKNISLMIRSGEHVAFVGASGAGKSTTILLMLRGSDPQMGKILIDGIDLKELDLNFYRQHVGVVEQHIVLFDDTVRRNISFGLPDGKLLSDEELEKLSKITRLDEFKDKLVDGWDTIIGENGIKLSGGQRQRVGIARALAKNPSILILDEATSSLDAKNEALIKEALHDASEGRTTIMVAHRLSTIKDADRIFVFDKGTIVGVGKHEELLETCPIYADLVSHQTVLL